MRSEATESSNVKRRSDSSDEPAEKRSHSEKVPLEDMVEKPRDLAAAAVGALSWDLVEGMLPGYLKTRTKEEIIKVIGDELEGMSRRRITALLEGEEYASSSSYESESAYSGSHSENEEEQGSRSELSTSIRSSRRGESTCSVSESQASNLSRSSSTGSPSCSKRSSPRLSSESSEEEIYICE